MLNKKIVLCEGVRTPIGHISKSLSGLLPEFLLKIAIDGLINKTCLSTEQINGVIIGWVGQGSHAPNIARISSLISNIPEKSPAYTIQCNCVSGIEAVSSAAKNILCDEGELYIAGGTESMSSFPYAIRGNRNIKSLRNIDSLKNNWNSVLDDESIKVLDCIEEGLTDPVKKINMAQTAEVCAQKFDISREAQDEYTHETLKRCSSAQDNGFYKNHVVPVIVNGKSILENDEYINLRKDIVQKPEMLKKAPVLFNSSIYPFEQFYNEFGKFIDNKKYAADKTVPTVTLFNSCARSDAAVVLIVTTEQKAKELGLKIKAEIKSWAYYGVNPAYMGIAPAFAANIALERAGLKFEDISNIELHEAFAATVLSVFKVGKENFNHDWQSKWENHKLNPNGGSIALGHPLAATGTRLIINLIEAFNYDPNSRYGLVAACAAGGIGGAMILERYGAN